MSNIFAGKAFNDILESILIDYQNLDPAPDVSKGSMVFIKAACLASCLYGLYKYQDYLGNQIFPDSADTDNLNHWGTVYGLSRQTVTNPDGSTSLESDPDFLTRLLVAIRKPSAGGNHYDWANWCQYYNSGNRIVTTTNLDSFGNGYYFSEVSVTTPGAGVVSLVCTPNDPSLSGAALTELEGLVTTNIELNRPVTANNYTIYTPVQFIVNVQVYLDAASYTSSLANTIATDVQVYVNSLSAGQALYQAKVAAIAVNDGANGATIYLNGVQTDIFVTNYQQIIAGSVGVFSL